MLCDDLIDDGHFATAHARQHHRLTYRAGQFFHVRPDHVGKSRLDGRGQAGQARAEPNAVRPATLNEAFRLQRRGDALNRRPWKAHQSGKRSKT
jgi:hypothetical protein